MLFNESSRRFNFKDQEAEVAWQRQLIIVSLARSSAIPTDRAILRDVENFAVKVIRIYTVK